MNDLFVLYALQALSTTLLGFVCFIVKGIFARMDSYGKRINSLEIDMARNCSENETLFKRLDNIERKLDKLLDNWRATK